MYCEQCGKQIDNDSRFCRFCGSTQLPVPSEEAHKDDAARSDAYRSPGPVTGQKKGNGGGKALGVVAAIVLGVLAIASLGKPDNGAPNNSQTAADLMTDNMEVQSDNMLDLADTAVNGATAANAAPDKAENWDYTTDVDKVRGGASYFASTTSTNSVHQDPPYDSDTTMRMTVRRMPSNGTDVVLTISSGQMMCPSYEGCSGTVRFDDGPAQRVSFNGPADSSSDTIFVIGAKSFIGKLKKAKKVIVEKTLYEAGNPQFEFDVSGLRWEH